MKHMLLRSAALTSLLFLIPHESWAQTSVGNGTSAVTSTLGRTQLEQIVVTAEHRRTNIQKTAIAISAISGYVIRQQAKNSFDSVLTAVPGVQINTGSPNTSTVVIRGALQAAGTDPSASTNYDGVYQSNVGVTPLFDIADVEVLKGPQGTLYGRNANAGAVNINSNDPTAKFGGSVLIQGGNYGAFRTEDVLNVPLTDTLLSRSALLYTEHSGYLSNGADDENSISVREKILYRPIDSIRVLLTAEMDRTDENGNGDVPVLATHPSNPWSSPDLHGNYRSAKYSYSGRFDWTPGWGTISYLPSVYHFFSDANDNILIFPGQGHTNLDGTIGTNFDQFVNELRIAALESSPLQWQAGLYKLIYRSKGIPLIAPLSGSGPITSDTTATADKTSSSAAFGQVTYPVIESFRLTGGLRYTQDTKSSDSPVVSPAGQIVTNFGAGKVTSSKLTYKLGVEYDVRPRSLLYASYATGFTSGGLNAVGSLTPSYAPETVKAYEVGSKNRFMEGRLELNADAYLDNYNNYQLAAVGACIPSTCPFPNTNINNAGKVRIWGAEAAGIWLLTDRDRVTGSVAYNNTKFIKFLYSALGAGLSVTTVDRSGEPLPLAPLWTETVGYEHTFDVADSGTIRLGGQIQFESSYESNIGLDPDEFQPSFHKSDMHLTYSPLNEKYSATAYVDNVENIATRQGTFYVNGVSLPRVQIAAPRTWGLMLSSKF